MRLRDEQMRWERENVQTNAHRKRHLSNLNPTKMSLFGRHKAESTADLLDILIRGNISHSNDLHHSFSLLNHSVSLSLSVTRRSPQCHWWWLSGSLSTSLINLGNREESASLTTLGSHSCAHARTHTKACRLSSAALPHNLLRHWALSHIQRQRK